MGMPGLAFAALILAATASMASAALPVTFVFGDSLTEVGNNNYMQYSLAKSNYPWYGIDYAGGQATGRFTNGRTIGDIISQKLGISSPPPYLSLSQNDDAVLKGVNYASGGAGILNDTGLYFIQRLSFDDQINYFAKTKETIKTKIGEVAANKLCNEATYFIGIGSNDYVNNFLQPFLADGQLYTPDEFMELLISTLEHQLSVKMLTPYSIFSSANTIKIHKELKLSLISCERGFVMLEALPTWSTKDGVSWPWASRLHSFSEGEIKDRPMLKASESMGSGIQLQSKTPSGLSQRPPPKCRTDICRHILSNSGLDRESQCLWF